MICSPNAGRRISRPSFFFRMEVLWPKTCNGIWSKCVRVMKKTQHPQFLMSHPVLLDCFFCSHPHFFLFPFGAFSSLQLDHWYWSAIRRIPESKLPKSSSCLVEALSWKTSLTSEIWDQLLLKDVLVKVLNLENSLNHVDRFFLFFVHHIFIPNMCFKFTRDRVVKHAECGPTARQSIAMWAKACAQNPSRIKIPLPNYQIHQQILRNV